VAKAPRRPYWTSVFADEIMLLVIKPRLEEILREGVWSKSDLRRKFEERHKCVVSIDTLSKWLKVCELQHVFTAKPSYRLHGLPVKPPVKQRKVSPQLTLFDYEDDAQESVPRSPGDGWIGPPPDDTPPVPEEKKPRTVL